jgi:hypothetical protein
MRHKFPSEVFFVVINVFFILEGLQVVQGVHGVPGVLGVHGFRGV